MSEQSFRALPGLPGGKPLALYKGGHERQVLSQTRLERVLRGRVVLASEAIPGVELVTKTYPAVNMTETAIAGFKSVRREDRAASVLTAMIATVYRAMEAGAPLGELQIAHYGIRVLSEVLDGNFSDPLVPERSSKRCTPTLFLCGKAWVMGAVICQERLDKSDRIVACSKVADALDQWLAPAKLKDTFPVYNAKDRVLRQTGYSEKHGRLHECSSTIARWLKSEERDATDRLPKDSAAALQYAAIVRWLDQNSATDTVLEKHLEVCARMLIDSSTTAQAGILAEASEIE